MEEKKAYIFGIILKKENKIIKTIDLMNINTKHKHSEIGYCLAKKYWNKGIISKATKLILNFGFNKLKLHRVYIRVFEPNKVSQKVLKKAGFKFEGNFIEHAFKRGKHYNELRFGILRKNFKF